MAWLTAIAIPFIILLWLSDVFSTLIPESIGALLSNFLSTLFQALLLWAAIGWKSLFEHVKAVSASSTPEQARQKVGYIVGRNTSHMTEQDIHRATIESLAENTSDAIIAPLFWFALLGAPGAWLYRMINTLDAMWGYKNKRYRHFGWCAAKTDDLANFVPARITALLLLIQKPALFRKPVLQQIRQQAGQHLSPNAGFPETAMAFLLDLKLGGPVVRHGNIEHRAWMGNHENPIQKTHILRALQSSHICNLLAITMLAATLFSK